MVQVISGCPPKAVIFRILLLHSHVHVNSQFTLKLITISHGKYQTSSCAKPTLWLSTRLWTCLILTPVPGFPRLEQSSILIGNPVQADGDEITDECLDRDANGLKPIVEVRVGVDRRYGGSGRPQDQCVVACLSVDSGHCAALPARCTSSDPQQTNRSCSSLIQFYRKIASSVHR